MLANIVCDIWKENKFMKKAIVFFVLVMFLFCSCSNGQKVVGTWVDSQNNAWIFSSDGKLSYVNGSADDIREYQYVITGTKLSMQVDGSSQIYDISMSDNGKTLILTGGSNFYSWRIAGPGWSKNQLTKFNPVSLTEKRWVDGSINSTSSCIAYSFNAVSGKTYYIWTNDDAEGDGSKSLDIEFNVIVDNDGGDGDDCWTDPFIFTASSNCRVIIMVKAVDEGDTGTFAIAYSTISTRP